MSKYIELFGCREGNLRGIDIQIPYNQITVITGISGSGKSSLAFKTVFAEGRRRIIESLDPRESYFLSNFCSPKLDLALGLPPAIAIRQTQHIRSPQSTLGSISRINSFIFLIYSACGDIPCEYCNDEGISKFNPPYSPKCGRCGKPVKQFLPGAFSNLSPIGMCKECSGTGVIQSVDETLIYPNQELSIDQGGLAYGGPKKGTMKHDFFKKLLNQFGFNTDTPIKNLSQESKVALLFGVKKGKKYKVEFPGIIPSIMKTLKETKSEKVRAELMFFLTETTCPECEGHGINVTVR